MTWALQQSPPWRFAVAFIEPGLMAESSATLTLLDRLATNRDVTYEINKPSFATGDVPSDNPQVNILRVAGGNPYLWYNNRFLFGFRREGAGSPGRPPGYPPNAPWVIRFAGIIQQLEREAQSDQPMSHYTAFDPWQYWIANRPIVMADGTLPGKEGRTFKNTRGDLIATQLLDDCLLAHGPLFADFGQTSQYGGTLEHTAPLDINFPQGTTLGDALTQLTDTASMDIVLTPIYDLVNRPGLICELSIYAEAGGINNGAIFGWDVTGTLSGIDLLHDGSQMANRVIYWTAGKAQPGTVEKPTPDSAPTFGQYWWQNVTGDSSSKAYGDLLAQAQADLRRKGKDSLTIDPLPERSPVPWNQYFVGDKIPVYAKREHFGEDVTPGPVSSHVEWDNLYRIYRMPIRISDDEVETVESMLMTGDFFS